ncbi:class I SAM-dependent methyltransferase [Streptococcus sp. DD13]|uniref:class I SAM-dependent methyltransferase n=1 Tax=Streptococcus sp. DD13 TaxID=1777881 RepID=UPI00082B9D69|nr:class I SAM-dependent methyltransferase [Streptococcus sp. DD13]
MTNMYYEKKPTSDHDIHDVKVSLLHHELQFYTDAGVFSKKMVDFGSQVLLNSLKIEDGKSLLDMGCGYGPMGIALAKAYNLQVTMVDINERAIDLAKKNAVRNQVQLTIFQSNLYEEVEGTFDFIISNPPIRAGKKVVHQIIEEAVSYLKPSGRLTIVIQKKQGAPSAKAKMEEVFGNCEIIKKDKGYYILESRYQ